MHDGCPHSTENPLTPQNVNNPFPYYARMRDLGAVAFSDPLHSYVVTHLPEAMEVLRHEGASNRRLEHNATHLDPEVAAQFPLLRQDALPMLFSDPPEHTRMRAMLQPAFSPKAVDAMEPVVRQMADDLLAPFRGKGEMDVVADFAYPLPAMVISHMLGIPTEGCHQYRTWSNDLARHIGGMPYSTLAANRSYNELTEFLAQYVREYRTAPKEGLISMLLEHEKNGRVQSEQELIAICAIVLWSGFETTTNLISNGLFHLLHNREQFEAVREDPSLIPGAVEEMLRYDSPIQGLFRHMKQPMEVAGQCIATTDNVLTLLGAANRDANVFPDGEKFNVNRKENRHMAFGAGIHFCLGAALARLEGRVAMEYLLQLPNLRLVSSVVPFRSNWLIRGVRSLPVQFG